MAVADTHPGLAELEAFTLGTLDEDALARSIEAHVAFCPSCQERAAVASGDTLVELLRRVHKRTATHGETMSEATTLAPTPLPVPGEYLGPTLPALPQVAPDATDVLTVLPPELTRHERYRVLRLLGEGGMGAVYEAEHSVMKRHVALKVIHRTFTANTAAVERFQREVRAAARLSHPNIVTAYDAENAGETHFLVMEYVQGVSLARLVKERGPLPVNEACDYIRQAALGLQHAHERGMVHRDVKPDNLIRAADGQVKVLDFGLATLTAEHGSGLTEANLLMGTPEFMAPEQAEDAHNADARADVYSLGCTLYYLLSQRVPYPAKTKLQKVLAHREQPLPSLSKVCPDAPPELAAVLARMLAKKPDERFQTAAAVADALEPFARSRVVSPSRKRRRRFVAVAAAALLIGSGLAIPLAYAIWAAATYRVQTDNGEIVIQTDDPDVEVVMKRGGQLVRIIDPKSKQTWELDTTKYQIGMADQPDGLKIELPNKEPFTLKRGEAGIVRVTREPKVAVQPDGPKELSLAAPKTLEVVRTLSWPNRSFRTSFSADGRLCVGVAGYDFRVWEVDPPKVVRDFAGLPNIGTVCFLPSGKQLLSSHVDGTFRLWELATGKLLAQLQGPVGWNQLGGITPDGTRFCFHGAQGISVYDLEKRKELFHVAPLDKSLLMASHGLSPDGKQLLTMDRGNREVETVLRLFNVDTGKLIRSIPFKFCGDTVAWSEDSRRVYLNASDITSWDAETGELLSNVQLVPEPGSTYGRQFSRDGRFFGVLYPDKKLLHLYDTRSGQLVGTANALVAEFALSFSPNGREAACGSKGEVILYRLPALPAAKDKP